MRIYKDAFHEYLVHGQHDAVNPRPSGDEGLRGLSSSTIEGRRARRFFNSACAEPARPSLPATQWDDVFEARIREANEFYADLSRPICSEEARHVQRQAFAGLFWSKQFYHFVVEDLAERRSEHAEAAGAAQRGTQLTNGVICSTKT